ncbi:hypothetical protein HMPREF9711_02191 [Myroides odoratimimus CCUG 3837]|nr:hypothetical protein HMPREF9711_02191 [Myroides odoratimimus CCUG 3837]
MDYRNSVVIGVGANCNLPLQKNNITVLQKNKKPRMRQLVVLAGYISFVY